MFRLILVLLILSACGREIVNPAPEPLRLNICRSKTFTNSDGTSCFVQCIQPKDINNEDALEVIFNHNCY